MPSEKHRINVALGKRLAAATSKAAGRMGVPPTTLVRLALIEKLRASGDVTDDELEADAAEDAARPRGGGRPRRTEKP